MYDLLLFKYIITKSTEVGIYMILKQPDLYVL